MFGIFMFYKPLSTFLFIKNKILKAAYDGTMVGIAAQILTVPLTLYYFHQFPNYFIITNLGLMVFSFLILALGVALFSLNWIPFVGSSIAYLLTFSLYVMLLIIDFIDSLPGAVSAGFVLNTTLVILLFATILYFFISLKTEKIKQIRISLLAAFMLSISIVYLRYNQLVTEKVFFLNADETSFIVKSEDKNFVFFANKKGERKKIEFTAKSFEKMYPGNLHYFEISNKKETHVRSKKLNIDIIRQKGGYEISINESKYFLVISLANTSQIKRKIYANKFNVPNSNYQLRKGALAFDL
jgi:competence protein ComEC